MCLCVGEQTTNRVEGEANVTLVTSGCLLRGPRYDFLSPFAP